MKKMQLVLMVSVILLSFAVVSPGCAQFAKNPDADLYGENLGDRIVLDWDLHDSATEYIVYRSPSPNGPWTELARVREVVARTSGARVDVTPDASLMDLCYKVEATDAKGNVIRRYEPMCVPKFTGK